MFVQEGDTCEDPPLPLTENLDEEIRKNLEEAKRPMKGILVVNVVMARNLLMMDKNGSDPYCIVTFPDKSTVFIFLF